MEGGLASAQKSHGSFCPSHNDKDPLTRDGDLALVPGTPYFLFKPCCVSFLWLTP